LGVHPNFWGCNVPSNSSFGGTKKMNCIFSIQFCIKNNIWQGIYNITKKWWDRHKGHGSDRSPVPVWPNVRQKKKVFTNSSYCDLLVYLIKHKQSLILGEQSFWNSSDLGGRKSWGPPITSVMPVPMSAKHFWMMWWMIQIRDVVFF
jgi:hypothetical protein